MLPDGSRNAQSRGPQPWSVGSWRTSAPDACTVSKRRVHVVGGEDEHRQDALGEQLRDDVAVGLRPAGVRVGEHDAQAGLGVAAERDPAVPAGGHVLLDLEAEGVPVEGERLVDVADGDVGVLE